MSYISVHLSEEKKKRKRVAKLLSEEPSSRRQKKNLRDTEYNSDLISEVKSLFYQYSYWNCIGLYGYTDPETRPER